MIYIREKRLQEATENDVKSEAHYIANSLPPQSVSTTAALGITPSPDPSQWKATEATNTAGDARGRKADSRQLKRTSIAATVRRQPRNLR